MNTTVRESTICIPNPEVIQNRAKFPFTTHKQKAQPKYWYSIEAVKRARPDGAHGGAIKYPPGWMAGAAIGTLVGLLHGTLAGLIVMLSVMQGAADRGNVARAGQNPNQEEERDSEIEERDWEFEQENH